MAGIVYHANYLKFIERARSSWVKAQGVDQRALREDGTVFVVRRMESDFLASAFFEDELTVHTDVIAVSGARLVLKQRVLRGEQPLFESLVTVVAAGLDGRPKRLPDPIRKLSPTSSDRHMA